MDPINIILVFVAVFALVTAVFAALKWTPWWSILLVVLFPFVGFLFVLWDAWKATSGERPPLVDVKSWSSLFDREAHGVLVIFAVAHVLAYLVSELADLLVWALFGLSGGEVPLGVHGLFLAKQAAVAVLLLVAFHLVRRDWILPLCWGLISALLGIFVRLVLPAVQPGEAIFPQPLDLSALLAPFLFGVLFMSSLVASVRLGGVRLRSLVVGAVVGYVLFQIVLQAAVPVVYETDFFWEAALASLTSSAIAGVVYGALVYSALLLHFRLREHPLSTRQRTAEPPESGGHAKDEPQTVELRGDWLNTIWKDEPVVVPAEADVAMELLAQEKLPYLWPEDRRYVTEVDGAPDPQYRLRLHWTTVFLNHPNPVVVERTLENHVTSDLLNAWSVAFYLPFLLVHPSRGVREQAARRFWECPSDLMIGNLFGAFSRNYAGITSAPASLSGGEAFEEQKEDIVRLLRERCPSERTGLFEEKVLETFGPSLARLRETESPSGDGVQYKETESKQGPMGVRQTYEVYKADSKTAALSFLEQKKVSQEYYYLIVETPEGNWGKDRMGMFEE